MTPRLASVLLGLSALSALGACASVPEPSGPPVSSAADRHAITVEQISERLDVEVGGDVALTPKAREDIDLFAGGYLRYGHGALLLSTPSGAGNDDAASRSAHATRLALAEAGVPYEAIAGSNYDASGNSEAPIVLSFARYEAQAPECAPIWEQDIAHQSNNQPWASFGCATNANLAAMIEDPRDLLRARNEDPRDSGRRNTVMDRYRQGQPTHADRSDDERSTVSTVAN
jgi:pilus assembly protein CpaD